jgi:hypothetical protein
MEIRNYILIDDDIKLKKIQNVDILDFLIKYNIELMIKDFKEERIDNLLLNKWNVIYYIMLDKNYILTFDSNEYDFTYSLLIELNRDKKINHLLNN